MNAIKCAEQIEALAEIANQMDWPEPFNKVQAKYSQLAPEAARHIRELQAYKEAWIEINRVVAPFRTGGWPHHCDTEDHEDDVDVFDCIANRFGIADD